MRNRIQMNPFSQNQQDLRLFEPVPLEVPNQSLIGNKKTNSKERIDGKKR